MCGIFGYYDSRGVSMKPATLIDMANSIIHRGPDDRGIFTHEGVAIGNQRLSIIDIEGGNQPFISDDGKVVVVQNGEIFNHLELAEELKTSGFPCKTNSDTEVILRLYQRDGIDFVSKLNGMFSIAIYDANRDELLLFRDRVGVKPLYYYRDSNRIIFASEIKSILQANVAREVDEVSINHYLAYNFVPPPFTMFKNIVHLMPGHWMRITRDNVYITQWWDLAQQQQQDEHSEEYWIDHFLSILEDSVRIRLRADVPFGAFLSGGVDSSTIVGLMSRYMESPVKTFSIGFHDPKYDESIYSQQVAEMFNTEHIMEKVDTNMLQLWPLATYHCDQPHGDVSFMPTYRVSQLAAAHVKMVLTGDGGDELFAGYDKYKNFFNDEIERLDERSFQKAYFDNISLFTDERKDQLFTPEFRKKVQHESSRDITSQLFQKCSHMDRINQALYIDTMMLLPGNNLVKPDRMGMAVSLEARTPFLDYRMVEFAFKIPGSLKLKNGETKYIYKKAVESLLTKELVYRKKQMFTVPIGDWFKSELAAFTEEKLLHGQLVKRNIVDKNFVYHMLKSHQIGQENNTREIRALISLEYWFEEFMV